MIAEMQMMNMIGSLISTIAWIITVVLALVLFFAVLKIKSNAVTINLRLRTLNNILREVHKEKLPEGKCPRCGTESPYGKNSCSKCNLELIW